MPPAGFMPIRMPVRIQWSRIASSITSVTGMVAAGWTLPVDVLMKTSPSFGAGVPGTLHDASIARSLARRTLSSVSSSPVSRMIFRCAGTPLGGAAHSARVSRISRAISSNRPARNSPRLITMSISSAPAAIASAQSRRRMSRGYCALGKPVATAATFTPLPASASFATGTIIG